jgi:hypothetical protein
MGEEQRVVILPPEQDMAEQKIGAPDVRVLIDDRIRLMSAVLAATDWPDKVHERKPHGTHLHARATRKHLHEFKTHGAVLAMQGLLNQGAPLEAMFALAMHMSWPELEIEAMPRWAPAGWNRQLRDFYLKSNLAQWWQDENDAWQKAVKEAKHAFDHVMFRPFLKPFLGDIAEEFVFVPNISYPTDQEIGLRLGREILVLTPPPLAWGDSPPWPYDEESQLVHSYRAALTQIGRLLLIAYLRANAEKVAEASKTELPVGDQFKATYPTWEEQFTALFVAAAVALYLEDFVSKAEASAYVLMERKVRGMTILPGMISVMRRYLSELDKGRYTNLIDFLPVFPKQLRVAKKIVTL